MAAKKKYDKSKRDSGGFIALPFVVVDSAAYRGLSPWARHLLIEIARQIKSDNNGMLLCSRNYMLTRGWKSTDMLMKSKTELLASGLLHQTVMGKRPNKASWYAVTWLDLERNDGYDKDLVLGFRRGGYRMEEKTADPLPIKPTRQELYEKWRPVPKKTQALDRRTVQEDSV